MRATSLVCHHAAYAKKHLVTHQPDATRLVGAGGCRLFRKGGKERMPTRTTGIFRPLPNPSSPDKRPPRRGERSGRNSATAQERRGQRDRESEREKEREDWYWGHSSWFARDLVWEARERRGREGRAKLRELIVQGFRV